MGIVRIGRVRRGASPCRQTPQDKRERVLRLLRDPAWANRSTNWIAREAKVSWLFADKVRTLHEGDATPGKRTARDGSTHPPYTEKRR